MPRRNLGKTAKAKATLKEAAAASAGALKRGERGPLSTEEAFVEAQLGRAKIERQRKNRFGGRFVRAPGEVRVPRQLSNVKMDYVSMAVVDIHALQRRVHIATLVSDLINLWLERATDYQQAIFRECLPSGFRHAAVPERYQGYLASLGYVPSINGETTYQDQVAQTVQPPPPPMASNYPPEPPPEVPTMPPLERVEPVAGNEALQAAPVEEVVPAPSVATTPIAIPAPVGWGSAAQAYSLGYQPGEKSVEQTMSEEVDKTVAEFREMHQKTRDAHLIPDERFGVKKDV